ncbi:MAG TPA: zf-HC2 domain-containing protein [Denitromonas sp.]|uniref:zf-HC2 domain-containing protein n=1 Tax=Denitromonas sp. TaxID=2734609 RepID=UPI001D260E57|nr:zf-HC2 domain-containing protein [Rhodocyclaceae bacterium]MCP5220929.1 zf-HC2 domain-containing protein [Zoogloeaceae bacterium]HPR07406.1 zf-HC2 domain-containing protein [Denitromonas sp.]HQU89701.1 zf-HC2 domain-containing protein [Denitromonas sp.]HQV15922.1 zf-HC2 domain-containing protein [Denitromonas sp.]
MLSCKEVSHLVSQAQDRKLGIAEKMQLELHLAMCKGCSNLRKQMDFLRDAMRRYPLADDDTHTDR